jgi:hypothetical protein
MSGGKKPWMKAVKAGLASTKGLNQVNAWVRERAVKFAKEEAKATGTV